LEFSGIAESLSSQGESETSRHEETALTFCIMLTYVCIRKRRRRQNTEQTLHLRWCTAPITIRHSPIADFLGHPVPRSHLLLMNRTEQAWERKNVAGTLLMDVQAAFNNTDSQLLGKRMEALGIQQDLIRWTGSFMRNRKVRLVLDGTEGEAYEVDTGIPQGSPAAPILFITYLSGIFEEVEKRVPGVKALSFADDISWWAEGKNDKEVAEKLAKASKAAVAWGEENGITFDHDKSEAVLFSRRRKAANETVKTGEREIPFNTEATRWLGIWLASHLTLRDHQRTMMKKGRKALARLKRLAGQMGLTSDNCRKVMTACVQSVAMYGTELWWKGKGKPGMSSGAGEL